MGGVVDTLFGSEGKQKSWSESYSKAWPAIEEAFGPALGYVGEAGGLASNILKQGPGGFADTGGFKFLLDQGTNQVNSNFASRGLGQSGAAMKGLEKYRHGLASTYLNQYMDQVFNLGKLGLGAGGVMTDAGRVSKSKSSGSSGKDGIAGDIIGAIAMSDPRLKENIEYAGINDEGISMYFYDYRQDTGLDLPKGRMYGPMANEVAVLKPSVVTVKDGYLAITDPALFPVAIETNLV